MTRDSNIFQFTFSIKSELSKGTDAFRDAQESNEVLETGNDGKNYNTNEVEANFLQLRKRKIVVVII